MYRNKEMIEDADVKTLGNKVIKEKDLDFSMCNISYVLVYPNISKTRVAKCSVANYRLHHFSNADYVVEFSGEVWDKLDSDTKYTLMWHMLEHVNPVYNEKRGEWNYKTRDKTVKDFKRIIDDKGVDWFGDLQTMVASIYDLDPEQRDRVKA